MNIKMVEIEFSQYITRSGTYGIVLQFPNGYGASLVPEHGHPGMFELAVLEGGRLCYDTPIANDFLRYQSAGEVRQALRQIMALGK